MESFTVAFYSIFIKEIIFFQYFEEKSEKNLNYFVCFIVPLLTDIIRVIDDHDAPLQKLTERFKTVHCIQHT